MTRYMRWAKYPTCVIKSDFPDAFPRWLRLSRPSSPPSSLIHFGQGHALPHLALTRCSLPPPRWEHLCIRKRHKMITVFLRRRVKISHRSNMSSLWVKVGLVQESAVLPAPHARYRGVFDRVPRRQQVRRQSRSTALSSMTRSSPFSQMSSGRPLKRNGTRPRCCDLHWLLVCSGLCYARPAAAVAAATRQFLRPNGLNVESVMNRP